MRRFCWHLASPCPPVIKQAWIDLLGPEVVWELYGGTELQALTFISGTQWLEHPGSVGVVVAGEMKVPDDDGGQRFFYLSDRRVDMFTVGGRSVYPAEIESALAEHPDVLSCLAVGIPDADLGQVPHTVEFTDRPLRNDAGKARRSAVRDEVIARLGC